MIWSRLTIDTKRLGAAALGVFALTALAAADVSSPAGGITSSSPFYAFDVVAQATSLGQQPSINNKGQVAFSSHTPGGLYYWDGTTSGGAVNINPGFTNANRSFGDAVQLSDDDHIG